MPRFFCERIESDCAIVTGEDARHLTRVLRIKPGEEYILCDGKGMDYRCEAVEISADAVRFSVREKSPNRTEPDSRIVLYQAIPKGDKLEFIIQKAVELGVGEVVPVLTAYCVSRPDLKNFDKKLERYRRIAREAAKQCGRGIIPEISNILTFERAVEDMAGGNSFLCYEGGGKRISQLVSPKAECIRVMVGSEGGFSEEEVEICSARGIPCATLGRRILRCETAPLAAVTLILNALGEL